MLVQTVGAVLFPTGYADDVDVTAPDLPKDFLADYQNTNPDIMTMTGTGSAPQLSLTPGMLFLLGALALLIITSKRG
jgi:hypothetical protein